MIIRSITAENFRKYKRLEINNIPEKGLITVSGENESGKTTIADALSFVLFGRTFLTTAENASKLIAWDAKNASVILNFIHQGEAYQLTRIIDRKGGVDAQLFSEKKADLIADTPEETERALHDILGYGYETFSDSYYLVQRELSTPHPNSDSIKEMVGISAYSRISKECHEANDRDDEALVSLRPRYEKTYNELQQLGIDDSWLPELVETRDTLETDQDYKRQLVTQLQTSADAYGNDRQAFIKATRKHRFFSVISDLLLAALLVALGLWAFIKFFPDIAQGVLMPQALDQFSMVSQWTELWMPLLAAVLAILYFMSMLFTWRTEDRQLTPLKQNAQLYAEALAESYNHVSTTLSDDFPSRTQQLITQSCEDAQTVKSTNHQQLARLHTLTEEVREYHADPDEAADSVRVMCSGMKQQQQQNTAQLQALNQEIDTEMERTAIAAGFRKKLADYDASIRQHTRNIKVQNKAIDLLRASAREFTDAFNNSITKTSGRILPFFTNDHYSNVKIDEDLNVAVFSKEKNDFMDFDEISSGTQRQIMLALRIAMSEELAKTNENNRQFIILDEPFAFFDHQRTVATLKKLPEVSEIISQVWVASQEFPEGTQADMKIVCPAGEDTLIM